MKELEGKIILSEGCAIKEAHLDDREMLAEFELDGNKYYVEGEKSHTRDYHWEEVRIYNTNGYNVVGYGKYKWLNRPWYRFTYASALRQAILSLFGKEAESKIDDAIETSSSCQEALNKFVSSYKEEPIEEGAEGKREQGFEYVIYKSDEKNEKAPIVAIRSTRVEAEHYCRSNDTDCSYDKVPKGKFHKGDDFWGPFDDNWELKEDKEEVEEPLPDAVPEEPIVVSDDVVDDKEIIDGGVISTLNNLIVDEFEAIEGYNDAIAGLNIMMNDGIDYTSAIEILNDIVNEENIHVGQLQELLKTLSEPANKIEDGKEEAEEILASAESPKEDEGAELEVKEVEEESLNKRYIKK